LTQILDSRDWRLFIREELLKHPRSELGVEYYLDIGNSSAMASGEDIEYTIEFKITADDPDARVELFRELTTGETDDEDRLNSLFDWAIKQMLNQRQPASQQQNLDERLVRTWKGFLGI
jgi:type 1 glutamine amidotransferase